MNVRVGIVDCLEKHGEAVLLVRLPSLRGASEPVLVSDLDVLERKGLGVAILGANCTPGGIGRASDEFNLVERIVDEWL